LIKKKKGGKGKNYRGGGGGRVAAFFSTGARKGGEDEGPLSNPLTFAAIKKGKKSEKRRSG